MFIFVTLKIEIRILYGLWFEMSMSELRMNFKNDFLMPFYLKTKNEQKVPTYH